MHSSIIQSVVLKRSHFTLPEAKAWIASHGYKHSKVDVTPHTFRFRQISPEIVKTGYRARMQKIGDVGYILIFYRE